MCGRLVGFGLDLGAGRPAARRAESRAEKQRRTAGADCRAAADAQADRSVEERVDLLHACFYGNELRAALDDETRVEPVALVHLERQAAEITKTFLPYEEKRSTLALELANRWDDVHRCGRRGDVAVPALGQHTDEVLAELGDAPGD